VEHDRDRSSFGASGKEELAHLAGVVSVAVDAALDERR
jgi:hypothetical protein